MHRSRRKKLRNKKLAGFTLVELMITAAIVAIMAGVALPSLIFYVRKSRLSEVNNNLKALFVGAASYYVKPTVSQGMTASSALSHCTVDYAAEPASTASYKQLGNFAAKAPFNALGFRVSEKVYYVYEITTTGMCSNPPGATVYFFRAWGDQDGDGILSYIDMAVGTTAESNELFKVGGLYYLNEYE